MRKIYHPMILQAGPIFGFMLAAVLLFVFGAFSFSEGDVGRYVAYFFCALALACMLISGYNLTVNRGIVYDSKKWRSHTLPFYIVQPFKNKWNYNFNPYNGYSFVSSVEDFGPNIQEKPISGTWYLTSNEPFDLFSLIGFFKIVFLGYVIVETPVGKKFIAKKVHFKNEINCLAIEVEYEKGLVVTEIVTKNRCNPLVPTNDSIVMNYKWEIEPFLRSVSLGINKAATH